MIIKSLDDRAADIEILGRLAAETSGDTRRRIEAELRALQAGLRAESDVAYYINFDLGNSKNWAVIHDLRLQVGDRVAQIDHLLINRVMEVFVLESKSIRTSLKISEEGEFIRYNEWKRTYEGMASPLTQNERHIAVLKEAIKHIELPSRLGFRLEPTYESYVRISPNTRIDRPKRFDTSRVVKADEFVKTIRRRMEEGSATKALLSAAKIISQSTLEEIGRKIAALHTPARFDYRAKFGLNRSTAAQIADPSDVESSSQMTASSYACRHCQSDRLSVMYGKYGYYFKCAVCGGNTPIKVGCGKPGHKERIRKDGSKFFRECGRCGRSVLIYTNVN